MQKFSDVVLDKNGKAIQGAVVKVTTYPDGQPTTIYAADGGPGMASVKTDAGGRFAFYAPNGHYSLNVSGSGIEPVTYNDIVLYDPIGQPVCVFDFMTSSQKADALSGSPNTDHTACFVNARAAAIAAGVPLLVPTATYRIDDASKFPDSSNSRAMVNVIMGASVKFVGTFANGNWFSTPTLGHSRGNNYNLIDGSYEYAAPSSAKEDPGAPGTYPFGSATKIYEMEPVPGFRGNADALFVHTLGNSGVNAALGAINALCAMLPGFLGNANAAEFDINNFAGDGKGLGLVIQGDGLYRLDSGIKILRIPNGSQSPTGAGGNWIPAYEFGIQVQNVEKGLEIDQSQVQNPQHAILIKPGPQRAADQPAIALQTPSGDVPFYVRADGLIAPRRTAPISVFAANVVSSGLANQTATQYLRADGFVQLAGWVTASSGTIAAGATLFTLDSHYRPDRSMIFPAMLNNGTFAWMQIAPSGEVTCGSGLGTSAALDLNCISYRLDN